MMAALQQPYAWRKATEVLRDVGVSTYMIYAGEPRNCTSRMGNSRKLIVVEMKEDYASLLYAEELMRVAMQTDDSDEDGTLCFKNPHPLPSSDSGTRLPEKEPDEVED